MRIGVVAPLVTPIAEPQLGGSQTLIADVASGLVRRGHDVDVYAATGSRIDGVNVVDTGVDPDELASTLFRAGREGAPDPSAAVRAFAGVYAEICEGQYDVVHNHAFDAPAIELAKSVEPPVVHTLHLPPDAAIAKALEDVDATVACVSEWSREAWSRHVRVDVVLRNGVPVDRIPFSPDGGKSALCGGRISPEKGVVDAIEIARRAGIPIVVIGNRYDEDYAREIEKDHAHVEIRQPVPRRALWELIGGPRVVLCPIKWDEPFGLVAAEAQATGTPVVGYKRGALPEVVAELESGTLGFDVDDLVQAVHVVEHFDRSAIRRHAERHLSLEHTLDTHEALYEKIVTT